VKREIEVLEIDERLTSWDAEKSMMRQGQKPWKDKGQIDTRAAILLLQDYLGEQDPSANLLPEPPEDADLSLFSSKNSAKSIRKQIRRGRVRNRRR